jgi:hypothetical protein
VKKSLLLQFLAMLVLHRVAGRPRGSNPRCGVRLLREADGHLFFRSDREGELVLLQRMEKASIIHFPARKNWSSCSVSKKRQITVADPDPGSVAFLTPGSGMGKKSGSGSGMNEHPGS